MARALRKLLVLPSVRCTEIQYQLLQHSQDSELLVWLDRKFVVRETKGNHLRGRRPLPSIDLPTAFPVFAYYAISLQHHNNAPRHHPLDHIDGKTNVCHKRAHNNE